MEKKNKHKKTIAKAFLAVFAIVVTLVTALPIGAVSGSFYTGNGNFSITYNTTNDVIEPICDSHLVLMDNNGRMDNYYTHDVCIQDNELIANNFMIQNGALSWDPLYPFEEWYMAKYPSSHNLPTFEFSRGGSPSNTNINVTGKTYNMTAGTENPNKNDYACMVVSRRDSDWYRFANSNRGNYILPRYYSVYAQDFLITGNFLKDFIWDSGYFGFRLDSIPSNIWTSGLYNFKIEYINLENGGEYTYTRSGEVGSLRNISGAYLRLPLFTTGCVNDLVASDTFGGNNLIYVKNVYINFDMSYDYAFTDNVLAGSAIKAYSGYVLCNNTNINGTDFDSNTPFAEWNVAFNKELYPEILASRQRYLASFAHNSDKDNTYTSFLGKALRGVLEPDIFGTFGLGDIMGIIIAFAVVMGFLKFFCGG